MNRIASTLGSCFPPFLLGICLSLVVSYFNHEEVYLPGAEPASQADCKLGDADCAGKPLKSESRIRIFCWIMVPYMMPLMNMMIINESWGPRCDGFAFVAPRVAVGLLKLPVIDVNETAYDYRRFHETEWKRIWLSAWQLYDNSRRDGASQQFDYFLLVRTGSYVIVENLRYLLRNRDPNQPFMLGRRMLKRYRGQPDEGEASNSNDDYLAADAGIVLSKGAFVAMVTRGFSGASSDAKTRRYCGSASISLSYETQLVSCLRSVGVNLIDSRDSRGRERFHPVQPGSLLRESHMPAWLKNDSYYRPVRACLSCPSPESVTFFGVTEFHKTDAMIYHVGPSLQRRTSQLD